MPNKIDLQLSQPSSVINPNLKRIYKKNRAVGMAKLVLSVSLVLLHSVLLAPFFIVILLLHLLIPSPKFQESIAHFFHHIGMLWINTNGRIFTKLNLTNWHIIGGGRIEEGKNYLVIANHQSWTDFFAMGYALNGRVPLPASFTTLGKNMTNSSKTFISFLEGSCLFQRKIKTQTSPFKNLDAPQPEKANHIISSVGPQLDGILNVTIAYPNQHGLLDFMKGNIDEIDVLIDKEAIPSQFVKEKHFCDNEFKVWLERMWAEKDGVLQNIKNLPW